MQQRLQQMQLLMNPQCHCLQPQRQLRLQQHCRFRLTQLRTMLLQQLIVPCLQAHVLLHHAVWHPGLALARGFADQIKHMLQESHGMDQGWCIRVLSDIDWGLTLNRQAAMLFCLSGNDSLPEKSFRIPNAECRQMVTGMPQCDWRRGSLCLSPW